MVDVHYHVTPTVLSALASIAPVYCAGIPRVAGTYFGGEVTVTIHGKTIKTNVNGGRLHEEVNYNWYNLEIHRLIGEYTVYKVDPNLAKPRAITEETISPESLTVSRRTKDKTFEIPLDV
jgi:hypothetical protein